MLIGGKWLPGSPENRIPVTNPATGDLLDNVAAGTTSDVIDAVEQADKAQRQWAKVAPRERSEILRQCWKTLLDHADELTDLIVAEHGKPRPDAKGEVSYAAEFFRWNAEETVRIHGSMGISPNGDKKVLVSHPPIGVVVMITPWNFPAAMITRKLAPALGAGNAVVIKPPKETPLTALRVAELCSDAGVPDGLINVIPTNDAAAWFDTAVAQRAVRMVSFTGSTEVGRLLLRRCADRVLKTVMELGGNAPFIVFEDADLDAAVDGAMVAKMRHSAETCTAANRFYVHADVAATFASKLAKAMGDVRLGEGNSEGVSCGPMINDEAIVSIHDLVESSIADGATLMVGGKPTEGPGHFYEPTVLKDVPADSELLRNEIFGPVAPIASFTDTDQMIADANSTEMGLAAYVYTADLGRGLQVCQRLESGMVGLNRGVVSDPAAPFGGMKQSGIGREGASDGIYEFCETQYIATNW